jgi:capsular exopolysaccharide synthesis family protein
MDEDRSKPVNIIELIRPLRRHWIVVLLAFACVMLTVSFFTFRAQPVYEAQAVLSVREGGDLRQQLFDVPSLFVQTNFIKDQVAILKSRRLAMATVRKLQQLDELDSQNRLSTVQTPLSSGKRTPLFFWKAENDTQTSAPTLYEQLARFRGATRVTYGRDSDILELRARSSIPWEAAIIVNKWVEAYQDYERIETWGKVIKTKEFLESKLEQVEKNLAYSEQQLSEFQKEEQVVSLADETHQLVEKLSTFEAMYNETRTELEAAENQYAFLRAQLDESKKTLVDDVSQLSNPVLRELQDKMANLVAQKATLEAQLINAGYKLKGNKEIANLQTRISAIKNEIVTETKKLVDSDLAHINPLDYSENLIKQILDVRTQRSTLLAKLEELKRIISEYTERLEKLPDKSRVLANFMRDVQVDDKIYTMLREKYEEIKIQEAGQVSMIQVVDLAVPPTVPVLPKKSRNFILGGLFGFLLGAGLAFSKDFLEDKVRNQDDLENMGLRVIGSVPYGRDHRSPAAYHSRIEDRGVSRARTIFPQLVTHQKPYSAIAEAYRTIRTSLYFSQQARNIRTVVLTSPGPSEGKSTTAANLAISLAKKGVFTLLVDSDLRRPVLDILFMGSHRNVGLSNYLRHHMSWREMIRETSVSHLHLLSSGEQVKNAPELLSSRTLLQFIRQSRQVYGMVVLDSPPLLPVTDALVLAAAADGVILVTRSGKTSRKEVRQSLNLLARTNTPLLGVVLNGVPVSEGYGYKEYYRSYAKEREGRWKRKAKS